MVALFVCLFAGLLIYFNCLITFWNKVPFVDVLTTMMDKSLPLTQHETDEWGDPTFDSGTYLTLAAYQFAFFRPLMYVYVRCGSMPNWWCEHVQNVICMMIMLICSPVSWCSWWGWLLEYSATNLFYLFFSLRRCFFQYKNDLSISKRKKPTLSSNATHNHSSR